MGSKIWIGWRLLELNSQLNSLPEYYLPKNQGGLIPAHQAGIYGLNEGGRINYIHGGITHPMMEEEDFREVQEHQEDMMVEQDSNSSSTGGTSGGNGSHDRGGQQHQKQAQVTSTKTAPPKDDGDGRSQALINISQQKKKDIYGDVDLEEQQAIDREIGFKKLDRHKKGLINLSKHEKNALEVGLGLRPPKQKRSIWKTIGMGAAIITGVAPLLGFQAPAAVQTVAQLNALHNKANRALATFNKFNNTNYTLEGLFNKVNDDKIKTYAAEEKLRAETKKLQEALPPGHPERIALEVQKKTRTTDTVERDGATQETSIKIENIEEVNDAKTQLNQRYKEMDEASYEAWLRQQEMEAKKQAYLRKFSQTYMSAQGGRVPAGYNTGGLSNLFRLKNV